MHVALFEDDNIMKDLPRNFGKLKSNPCTLFTDDTKYIRKVLEPSGISGINLNRVLEGSRKYTSILGLEYDSHYFVEKLGLSKASREYIIEIDMSTSLDLAFYLLTHSSIENIRKINDYNQISKALLRLDKHFLDIPVSKLMGVDEYLDEYLEDKLSIGGEEYCLEMLLRTILTKIGDILKYIGFYLQSNVNGVVMKSFGKNSIILHSYDKIDFDSIDLLVNAFGENLIYNIPIIITKSREVGR